MYSCIKTARSECHHGRTQKEKSNIKRYLRTAQCRWLGSYQLPWQHVHDSPVRPETKVCRGWGSVRSCGCGSSGNDAYRPFRNIRDGICRSWCDGGACHRHYRDLQDAFGAYLEYFCISKHNLAVKLFNVSSTHRYDRVHDWRVREAFGSSFVSWGTGNKQNSWINFMVRQKTTTHTCRKLKHRESRQFGRSSTEIHRKLVDDTLMLDHQLFSTLEMP